MHRTIYLSMRKKNLYFWKSLWSSYPKNQFLMSKGRPMIAISCQNVGRWSQVYNKSCWKYNWSQCTNFSSQKVWKMNSWRTIYSPFPHEPHTQIPNYILHVLSSFILKFEFPKNFLELPNYPPILRSHYHYSPLLFCPMIHSRCAYCQIARMKLLCVSIF